MQTSLSATTLEKKSGEKHGLLLLGMPVWDIAKPFYSLAVVGGIARESGVPVSLVDVNADFYHQVNDEERRYWSQNFVHLWLVDEVQDELWKKYESWFTRALDQALADSEPKLVAFSLNTATRGLSVNAARYIKKIRPDLPILFGGADCFPNEYHKRYLGEPGDRYCDIICHGEAEISFKKYLQEFARTGDWRAQCSGFSYYDGEKLVDTGWAELPTLKGEQPLPAFDLFDLSKYSSPGSLPFFFTRGCMFNCRFCSEKPNYRSFRSRDPEEVIRQLKAILPYAQAFDSRPTLHLADSNFDNNLKALDDILDLILKEGIDIRWNGMAHIDRRINRDFVEKLKRAGLVSVFWGIESGSQRVVDLMRKGYRHYDARRIIRDASDVGITQCIPIMVGFPGETPVDLTDTLQFMLEFKPLPHLCYLMMGPTKVTHNSPMFHRFAEWGLANNDYHHWQTADGTNTAATRNLRYFIVLQAYTNHDLDMEHLACPDTLDNVQINEPVTARDCYGVLAEMFRRCDRQARFREALESWANATGVAISDGENEDLFPLFSALEKDDAEGRRQICELILEGLRYVRALPPDLAAASPPTTFVPAASLALT